MLQILKTISPNLPKLLQVQTRNFKKSAEQILDEQPKRKIDLCWLISLIAIARLE